MTRWFAFLRAVNVGGRTVPMADLKAAFEGLGFTGVATFIASGNVAFTVRKGAEADLRPRIEAALEAAFGFEVDTFLRTEAELRGLLAGCPFTDAQAAAAGALNVAFLHAPLEAGAQAKLQALASGVDTFTCAGREVWWLCQVKQSGSAFSNAVFERNLKVRSTFRGFHTLQKLGAKLLP